MKSIYAILLLLVLIAGCSKKDSSNTTVTTPVVTVTPGTSTTPATATTNASQTVWHLTSMSVNNKPQTLTAQQSAFVMVLTTDKKYSDTDGINGNWSAPSADSLVVIQTNLPTMISLRYKIVEKTTERLSMNMGSGASQINLGYEAR